jgi:hypothetical protein
LILFLLMTSQSPRTRHGKKGTVAEAAEEDGVDREAEEEEEEVALGLGVEDEADSKL